MTLAILFSLKTVESLEKRVANPFWSDFIVTGRNEVLAKVIFSQACVILSTGVGIPACLAGQSQGGWVSQHALQVSPQRGCLVPGVSNFSGGGGVVEGGLRGTPHWRVGIPACLAGQSQGGGYPSMPCRSVLGGGIPACLASQSWGVSNFRGGGVVEGG